MKYLTQPDADEYASWFRCLADGTRLRVLHVVASADRPVTVGEIVEHLDKSQSTISRHLSVLAKERFVLMEPDGVRTLVRVNRECMSTLPMAAAAVMGANTTVRSS
ncbi:ArsR/SmtB family transcription factor [Ilumatobacter nonamiensis]|uniref:ArsR/SmtB family transcription factor n=1 Tax=Ilumatobacter nonamiensis TaxID=467093 RepID=UPI00034CAC54|nr:metalloregulator ArsR/SmtB family transcription factor [Ilumatobacter nonamiensis]